MRCASLPITLWVCLAANDFPCAWAATRSQPQISSRTLGAPACLRNFAGAHAAAFATHPNVQLPPAQTRDSSRGHALLAPRRAACRHTIRRTLFDVQPRGAICRPRTRMQLESGDSGGDEGLANSVQQWGRHGAKDGPQAGHVPMPNVPETIWAEFRALWLRAALRHAVRHEKYERAGRLKGQLESVQSQLMQAFEGSVHDRVARLRSKMGGSELLRLQHELEHAVAEEDYDRAAKTYQQLQLEHSKTPAFSGGFKVFEWAFLESDLDARIALHSLRMSLLESDMEMRVANLRARLVRHSRPAAAPSCLARSRAPLPWAACLQCAAYAIRGLSQTPILARALVRSTHACTRPHARAHPGRAGARHGVPPRERDARAHRVGGLRPRRS